MNGLAAMRIVSLNVGRAREIAGSGEPVRSAIFKQPVEGRVALRADRLDGDEQADPSVHGGVDKAVYAYPCEHYPYWREWLGTDALPWGAFGENLSTEGLLESELSIGDRLRVGSALLEVSQPRMPCRKLGLRHARADLPKHFFRSGRSGFYFRVVEEGELAAGDAIEVAQADPQRLRVADVQALVRGVGDETLRRRALAHPVLAEAWRAELRARGGSSG